MNENDFLTLVRRWQDPGSWVTVEALGFNAADFEAMSDNLGADARICLDRGDIAAASELKAEADHLRKCAADVLRQRSELASQFMQIENWVREHRPELLEFVPTAAFSGEPSEAIRDLKRLESRIQKPAAAKTPSVASPPLSLPKEKWPREEYARDAIIRLKEKPELQSNILAFCRTIAEEQGVPEIAASLKKLLYQPDYQRLWKS